MPPDYPASLRDRIGNAGSSGCVLWGAGAVSLADVREGTGLSRPAMDFLDRSVLLATGDQLAAAIALVELDGIARRVILCPPDLPSTQLPAVIAKGGADAVVTDAEIPEDAIAGLPLRARCSSAVVPAGKRRPTNRRTEWALLTSGTTGAPKMILHTLASLTAPIPASRNREAGVVWGTFYDIRRYGGLQIFLRAVLGGQPLALSGAREPVGDFLLRLKARGATHISGTPSHWRRALMCPSARAIAPRYIRLSGEIVDQAILNSLRLAYPRASITHAFASTEAGVAFEVTDGHEGFPASTLGVGGDVELKIDSGSLRIRSARAALGYAGAADGIFASQDGFIDTGDRVELRGDRYYFLGRAAGVMNIGGLKVYPEEVEAVINRHPAVRMSLVQTRRNSLLGSLVAADVVLKEDPDRGASGIQDLQREILGLCRANLAAHKVPVTLRCVPALVVTDAGKLARSHA
jgi:acyl-coenzyme A synthetase/AMP-(fatty) acid ligase